MLKQQLNLKLQQKLSPLQLQVIKMLEFPSIEMEERIREEMENNPALETDELAPEPSKTNDQDSEDFKEKGTTEQIEWDDYAPEDDIPEYKLRTNNYSKDNESDTVIPFAAGITFHETLMDQLSLCAFSDKQNLLAEYLIGNIGDDGYLRRDLESLEDDLAFQQGIMITQKELEVILKRIQAFDPAGVGARNLKECLLLQLQRFKPTPPVVLALKILDKYFDHFARKSYTYILKHLNCSEEEFKAAVKEVLKLNPKPGSAYAQSSDLISQRITPDFIIEEEENNILTIRLNNSNIPELRVNRHYKEMLEDYNGNEKNQTQKMKDALIFARQKIDSARWFIDAIKQRNTTLMKTMKTILKLQYDFFLTGDDMQLKPMKLKDIADITGYDISTISRVSNSKYVDTKFGIFSLKHFFSETMHTTSGEIVSNKGIKKIIQTYIEQEDKKNPVTDQQLTEMLKDLGYQIARRTVAKYREKLHIPVARLRQEQF